jgi:hypothetical protein
MGGPGGGFEISQLARNAVKKKARTPEKLIRNVSFRFITPTIKQLACL